MHDLGYDHDADDHWLSRTSSRIIHRHHQEEFGKKKSRKTKRDIFIVPGTVTYSLITNKGNKGKKQTTVPQIDETRLNTYWDHLEDCTWTTIWNSGTYLPRTILPSSTTIWSREIHLDPCSPCKSCSRSGLDCFTNRLLCFVNILGCNNEWTSASWPFRARFED
jgi:hypothetical protein